MPSRPIDPAELAIAGALFSSVADEMGVTLGRSAHSPNIKERRDYSSPLFHPPPSPGPPPPPPPPAPPPVFAPAPSPPRPAPPEALGGRAAAQPPALIG